MAALGYKLTKNFTESIMKVCFPGYVAIYFYYAWLFFLDNVLVCFRIFVKVRQLA